MAAIEQQPGWLGYAYGRIPKPKNGDKITCTTFLEYYDGEWMSEGEASARRSHDYYWPGSKKIGISE